MKHTQFFIYFFFFRGVGLTLRALSIIVDEFLFIVDQCSYRSQVCINTLVLVHYRFYSNHSLTDTRSRVIIVLKVLRSLNLLAVASRATVSWHLV